MQPSDKDSQHGLRALVIGAIGAVFGAIGTSPLHTLKQAFGRQYGLKPDDGSVLGVLDVLQGTPMWRDKLYLLMSRNATPATEFFSVPGNRLVELGTQVIV